MKILGRKTQNNDLKFLFAGVLLILDFSGSMEQKIMKRTKREVLVENVKAFSSSLAEQEKIQLVYFGSSKQTNCQKTLNETLFPKALPAWLDRQVPQAYSKTPIGLAIENASDLAIQNKITQMIAITDGADTCGKKICEVLKAQDQKLKKNSIKMKFHLVGYDLKSNERSSFDCSKDGYDSIDYRLHDAGKKDSLTRVLESITGDIKEAKSGQGTLQITGAPPGVLFRAIRLTTAQAGVAYNKKWYGPFPVDLPSGRFTIQIENLLKKVSTFVTINAGEKKILRYGVDFEAPGVSIIFKNVVLGLAIVPKTKDGVGTERKAIYGSAPGSIAVPPGQWVVQIHDPEWLAGTVLRELDVATDETQEIDLKPDADKVLDWIQNPSSRGEANVIEVKPKGGSIKQGMVTAEQIVPIPKGATFKWKNTEEMYR